MKLITLFKSDIDHKFGIHKWKIYTRDKIINEILYYDILIGKLWNPSVEQININIYIQLQNILNPIKE